MSDIKFTVNVDEYLSLNKYEVDESNAHIELVEDPSDEEFDKLRCTSVTRMARSLSTTPAAWNAVPAASLVATPSSRSGKTRSLPWVWSTASAKPSAIYRIKRKEPSGSFLFYMAQTHRGLGLCCSFGPAWRWVRFGPRLATASPFRLRYALAWLRLTF